MTGIGCGVWFTFFVFIGALVLLLAGLVVDEVHVEDLAVLRGRERVELVGVDVDLHEALVLVDGRDDFLLMGVGLHHGVLVLAPKAHRLLQLVALASQSRQLCL